MMSLRSSCSLFGMIRHHVTALAAILVCNLLLISAQSTSDTDALKILTANNAGAAHRNPPSYHPKHPSFPSQPPSNDAANQVAMNSDLQEEEGPSNSDKSHVMSSAAETEMEDASVSANRFVPPNLSLEEWKRMYDGAIPADLSKRFLQGFVGSRGKRSLNEDDSLYEGGISIDDLSKRFIQGFVGSRGKRVMEEGALPEKRFFPVTPDMWKRVTAGKRFYPSGFAASRGKRYMPGLEALLLSQMYKKLDAEKWKRQSMLGFHASRG